MADQFQKFAAKNRNCTTLKCIPVSLSNTLVSLNNTQVILTTTLVSQNNTSVSLSSVLVSLGLR